MDHSLGYHPRSEEDDSLDSGKGKRRATYETSTAYRLRSSSSPNTTNSSSTSADSSMDPKDVRQWQRHIKMSEFTKSLNTSLQGVFPNNGRSRYKKVFVLITYWDSQEAGGVREYIGDLYTVFVEHYHFTVEIFKIPPTRSHVMLSRKINDFVFLNDDSKDDLKIFYYGGRSRFTDSNDLLLAAGISSSQGETVTWSGIQSTLEQAFSDVLIILDCCGGGSVRLGAGHGITEFIATCACQHENKVVEKQYAILFLIDALRRFGSSKRQVTAANLWEHLYTVSLDYYTQEYRSEAGCSAPVHFINPRGSTTGRSVDLSPLLTDPQRLHRRNAAQSMNINESGRRMLIAVRLEESVETDCMSVDGFRKWLQDIPTATDRVNVSYEIEGFFRSDSTLLLVTIPLALWTCIRDYPAVVTLGPVRSSNLLHAIPNRSPAFEKMKKGPIPGSSHTGLGMLKSLAGTTRMEGWLSDYDNPDAGFGELGVPFQGTPATGTLGIAQDLRKTDEGDQDKNNPK